MPLAKCFSACRLTINNKTRNESASVITIGSNGSLQVASFFVDSSGHSHFSLPLDLKFASQEDLDLALASNCIHPPPKNQTVDTVDKSPDGEKGTSLYASDLSKSNSHDSLSFETSFIGFEARCSSNDLHGRSVVVEAISILSTCIENLSVMFLTEVTVRASGVETRQNESSNKESSILKANIEVTPVLTFTKDLKDPEGVVGMTDLMALELGAIPDHMQKESSARIHETRLGSVSLELALCPAFTISVKSVPGGTMGKTMISLTILHSNLHRELVTINNLAIHPGSSRIDSLNTDRGKVLGKYSVGKFQSS